MKKIIILGTGGTIAGRSLSGQSNTHYVAGGVAVADLLTGIEAPKGHTLVSEQIAQLDSKDMDEATWLSLAKRCASHLADHEVAGVVITHGTDTLEESAFFLHSVLTANKPVVFTCAMRPATAVAPDGPQNLRDALVVVATPDAQGVVLVCAGEIHGAVGLRKVHPYRLNAFDTNDAGPLGYVEEGKVRLNRPWPSSEIICALDKLSAPLPLVEIVHSHAGANGRLIELMFNDKTTRLQGLIIAGTGNGSVHQDLEKAAVQAQKAGVKVWVTSRCSEGQVVGKVGPLVFGHLSPYQARIALMLNLVQPC